MLTGTLVNYYVHCKRQCWLFYHKLNMEDNSEDVRIGRVLHELQEEKGEGAVIGGIPLDKITHDYVTEIKKSDADIEAAIAQLQFYLVQLANKGICRKGRVEVLEKNKQSKKIHYTELDDEMIQKLDSLYAEIERFLHNKMPPEPILRPGCKKCAYFEYCFI